MRKNLFLQGKKETCLFQTFCATLFLFRISLFSRTFKVSFAPRYQLLRLIYFQKGRWNETKPCRFLVSTSWEAWVESWKLTSKNCGFFLFLLCSGSGRKLFLFLGCSPIWDICSSLYKNGNQEKNNPRFDRSAVLISSSVFFFGFLVKQMHKIAILWFPETFPLSFPLYMHRSVQVWNRKTHRRRKSTVYWIFFLDCSRFFCCFKWGKTFQVHSSFGPSEVFPPHRKPSLFACVQLGLVFLTKRVAMCQCCLEERLCLFLHNYEELAWKKEVQRTRISNVPGICLSQ